MTSDPTGQGQSGYAGQMGVSDANSDFNSIAFLIRTMIGDVRTIVPVKVVAVTGGGVGASPPTVDVQSLVMQMDGAGNTTPHGLLLDLPVIRWQAGGAAIVADPVVGDIGVILVCDRDISAVEAAQGQAAPGSFRRHNLADGIYLGGILNAAPTKYVALTSTGIKMVDGNGNIVEMKAGSIAITGNVTITGSVIAGFGGGDQVGLQTHLHTANNTPPTPGS